jgi:hypothetical protein
MCVCMLRWRAGTGRGSGQGWVTGSARAAVHGKPGRADNVGTTVESHLHSGRAGQGGQGGAARVVKRRRLRPGLGSGGKRRAVWLVGSGPDDQSA